MLSVLQGAAITEYMSLPPELSRTDTSFFQFVVVVVVVLFLLFCLFFK